MLIDRSLIEGSAKRLDFSPSKLDQTLGDGPLDLSSTQRSKRFRQVTEENQDPAVAASALERIVGGNDLVGINYLSKGMAASRPVCRIQLKDANSRLVGYATGFLIGPGLLMTNHHVFGVAGDAVNSLLDFDYEQDLTGKDRPLIQFRLAPNQFFYANKQLDFAVCAVSPKSVDGTRELKDWGWLFLDGEPGKADLGEYLTIIQHPAGQKKQVCVRENKLLKLQADTLWYMTDTLGGSSGSPAFNRFWQVVALHHSGVPKTNSKGQWLTRDGKVWMEGMDESLVDWIANEGIRISSIVKDLKAKFGTNAVVKAALESGPFVANESVSVSRPAGANLWVEQDGSGTSLVVPLRIPIDLVQRSMPAVVSSEDPAPVVVDSPGVLVEAVNIDQSTLGSRPGYKPNFLGSGKLLVPLPKIPAGLKSQVATLSGKASESELKYFNYSVVMNKKRKLAFFAAVNIDGDGQQDVGKREGDSWLRDPRIDAAAQVGDEYYGKQKLFEVDRTKNPFDRGHLVRRLDATWGKTVEEAKMHGDDSFHFTNCTPQFFKFNQGAKLWLGLEEFVLGQAIDGKRKLCVMNGPIFDGPVAPKGKLPKPGGKKAADPKFGGLPIPKFFWKLMVGVKGGKLAASAYLLSQQDQVQGIDRIHESDLLEKLTAAEARVFQISIADLAKFSGLDFGALAAADTMVAAAGGVREIQMVEEIELQ
ncbi:MAG: DNA/RNA non-specific endonuclease [Acidobacteria bacterium]|nr:DNA/RNA non-specific endonuclease [Acidobacteriota bacterium]